MIAADTQRAAFIAALEAERQQRGLSWRAVAREAGVHPGSLYRLVHGGDVYASVVWELWEWLDAPRPAMSEAAHALTLLTGTLVPL